jgi:hypothetical protein
VLVLALPLVTGRFERTPHLGEIGLVLPANLASAVGGTALAALFSRPIVRNRAIALLGLSACALLTLPLDLASSPCSRSRSRWSAPCCGAAANDAGARLGSRSAQRP